MPPSRDSVAITSTKGLLNGPGQNNCFLNSAVQVSVPASAGVRAGRTRRPGAAPAGWVAYPHGAPAARPPRGPRQALRGDSRRPSAFGVRVLVRVLITPRQAPRGTRTRRRQRCMPHGTASPEASCPLPFSTGFVLLLSLEACLLCVLRQVGLSRHLWPAFGLPLAWRRFGWECPWRLPPAEGCVWTAPRHNATPRQAAADAVHDSV